MLSRGLVVAALFLFTLRATATELQPDAAARLLRVKRNGQQVATVELPDIPLRVLPIGSTAYVALGTSGLWVIDVSVPEQPQVVARLLGELNVRDVVRARDGTVQALSVNHWVDAFDVSRPAKPVPLGTRITGDVTEIHGGTVTLDRGTLDGLIVGAHVKICPAPAQPESSETFVEALLSPQCRAVLRITHASEHSGIAELGRGDVIRDGDIFSTTQQPLTAKIMFPGKQPLRHRIDLELRPIVEFPPSGGTAAGVIADLRYTYFFRELPLALELDSTPFAADANGTLAPAFAFLVAFDSTYFGLGVGPVVAVYRTASTNELGYLDTVQSTHGGIYFALRVGSLDGLNLEIRSSIVFHPSGCCDPSVARFGSFSAMGQIPVSRTVTLQAGGGAGDNGWLFAQVGLRVYVWGAGGPGSIILPLGLGFGSLSNGLTNTGGLLFATGLDVRL
jgi:hypothetical protein